MDSTTRFEKQQWFQQVEKSYIDYNWRQSDYLVRRDWRIRYYVNILTTYGIYYYTLSKESPT